MNEFKIRNGAITPTIEFKEQESVSNPQENSHKLFFKDNGKFYKKNSEGLEVEIGNDKLDVTSDETLNGNGSTTEPLGINLSKSNEWTAKQEIKVTGEDAFKVSKSDGTSVLTIDTDLEDLKRRRLCAICANKNAAFWLVVPNGMLQIPKTPLVRILKFLKNV